MMRDKRGVSGLIVAVLLLAVSLTIGGLVMGWISGYSGDNLDSASASADAQDECFDREFKVISVNATGPQGGNDGHATIIVENKNNEQIKGFLFKVVTETDELYAFENKTSSALLGGYLRATYRLTANSTNTNDVNSFADGASVADYNVSKIEIFPIIDVTSDTTVEVVCDGRSKEILSRNFINDQ